MTSTASSFQGLERELMLPACYPCSHFSFFRSWKEGGRQTITAVHGLGCGWGFFSALIVLEHVRSRACTEEKLVHSDRDGFFLFFLRMAVKTWSRTCHALYSRVMFITTVFWLPWCSALYMVVGQHLIMSVSAFLAVETAEDEGCYR